MGRHKEIRPGPPKPTGEARQRAFDFYRPTHTRVDGGHYVVGRIGNEVAREFFSRKTPAQIAQTRAQPLPVVLAILRKVTGEEIHANTKYVPREYPTLKEKGPDIQWKIDFSKERVINIERLFNRVLMQTGSGGSRRQRADKRSLFRQRALKALEFIIAYPHNPEKMQFNNTIKTKAFIHIKPVTDYLTKHKICSSRLQVSKILGFLVEENIIERIPPGGIRIVDEWNQK